MDVKFSKSLVSNFLAATLILIGWTISGPYQIYILNTGLFALSGGCLLYTSDAADE